MSAEIRSPERTVRPAIWLSTGFVSIFYAATTLAMLVLLRPESIHEIRGLADAAEAVAQVFAVPWIRFWWVACCSQVLLVCLGGVGTAISRMPFAAGADHLLPPAFGRIHRHWHTPHIALLTLGVVSSALLLLAQLGETMRVAYQEMVSLTFIGGFQPYIYIFMSAWKAQRRVAASVGLVVTLFCLAGSIMPGPEVDNVWLFAGKLTAGTAAMIGSGLLLYARGRARL